VDGARVLVLGLTFKENCSDIRNTRVIDLVRELHDYGVQVDVHDPWANPQEVLAEYGLRLIEKLPTGTYDGIILAVAHDVFRVRVGELRKVGREGHILYDLKHILPKEGSEVRL
jgi:UDP-N-acetyl-D-galactosamine dehydrogenase